MCYKFVCTFVNSCVFKIYNPFITAFLLPFFLPPSPTPLFVPSEDRRLITYNVPIGFKNSNWLTFVMVISERGLEDLAKKCHAGFSNYLLLSDFHYTVIPQFMSVSVHKQFSSNNSAKFCSYFWPPHWVMNITMAIFFTWAWT